MGRYDPYREPNFFERGLGWLGLGLLGLCALSLLSAGIQWLWHYFTGA